jgi:hypothetical protein
MTAPIRSREIDEQILTAFGGDLFCLVEIREPYGAIRPADIRGDQEERRCCDDDRRVSPEKALAENHIHRPLFEACRLM